MLSCVTALAAEHGHRIHVETRVLHRVTDGAIVKTPQSRTTCECGFLGEWVGPRVKAWAEADAHVEAPR